MDSDAGGNVVDVAVGVMLGSDGRFLLAKRPAGKPMAGYWEFPGGKVEPGEAVIDALKRELNEELGVQIELAYPWASRIFDYPHAKVRLHFWRCVQWQGTPASLECQELRWEGLTSLTTDPWLPGALPLRRWLALPSVYAISSAATIGCDAFLAAFARACENGLKMLQLREKALVPDALDALFREVLAIARNAGVLVLVNSEHPRSYWERADGVHLTSAALARLVERPAVNWCGASTHNAGELDLAGRLDCDFAVAGPVHSTSTHPGTEPLGWDAFAELIESATLPVYALGGLSRADLPVALTHGAQGVASLRGGLGGAALAPAVGRDGTGERTSVYDSP